MKSSLIDNIKLTDEVLLNKIYDIRGVKVMIDSDLAELYEVETKYLKRQVKRNINRFPGDFMFEMNKEEFADWRSQFVTSNSPAKMGLRYAPYVFTEQGVAQLSSVLRSDRAVQVNIQIIRLFTKMRRLILTHKDILLELEKVQKRMNDQDGKIEKVFNYLKQFIEEQEKPETPKTPRKLIGFKRKKQP